MKEMKTRHIFIPVVSLLPLAAVVVLAMFGIVLDFWVYVILVIVCPVVAGFLLYASKIMDKKVADTMKRQ